MRFGASECRSSPWTSGILSSAEPAQTSTTARSSVSDMVSSSTAGFSCKPAVDELTMSLTDDLAVVDVWAGSAELKIPEVQGEDLHSLAPKRIGRGYRLGMAYSVTDLRILKNYVR